MKRYHNIGSLLEDNFSGNCEVHRFTGQEFDKETSLYYYGARYYDPVLAHWTTVDPVLDKYFPKVNDLDDEHDCVWYELNNNINKLPGMGGVYNPVNLNLYHYAGNNPVKYVDPDGNAYIPGTAGALIGAVWGSITGVISGSMEAAHALRNGSSVNDAVNIVTSKSTGGLVGGAIAGAALEIGAEVSLGSGFLATAAGGAIAAGGGSLGEVARVGVSNLLLSENNSAYKEKLTVGDTVSAGAFNLFGAGLARQSKNLGNIRKTLMSTSSKTIRQGSETFKKVSTLNKRMRALNNVVPAEELIKTSWRKYVEIKESK